MNPKVSIIIPVFNGADYLEQAIESALGQTYQNLEVIVVNDGSDDGGLSEAIAKRYEQRIRYFYKENSGVAGALNFGIGKMSGEYFSWLSHDDLYAPQKIEAQINLIGVLNLNEPLIVYSDFCEINTKGGITYAVFPPKKFENNTLYLLSNHLINGCSLLIPKQCFDETGLFDESLRSTQDYDMWYRLMARYRFAHSHGFYVMSRRHEGQGTHTIGSHDEARSMLHIDILNKLSANDIRKYGFAPEKFYIGRAARLKKEGLPKASEHAFNLYLKFIEDNHLKRKKFAELITFCLNSKYISALAYMLKLVTTPKRWGLLLKILKGRIG